MSSKLPPSLLNFNNNFICRQCRSSSKIISAKYYTIQKKSLVGVARKESENLEAPANNETPDEISEIPKLKPATKLALFHKPSGQIFQIPSNKFHKELKFFGSDFPVSCLKDETDNIQSHLAEIINENINLSEKNRPRLRSADVDGELDDAEQFPKTVNDLMWREVKLSKKSVVKAFLILSKIRLTSLVVLTSMAGYAMAPGSFELLTFAACSAGVLLTSAAANSINQFLEVPFDSQMSRTMNRPIVRGDITPLQAMTFAGLTCTTGGLILFTFTNPLTATLGLVNVVLYTLVYTPMKRTNIANTWVGAIVGAIPPIMGWTAATGALDIGAILMGGILYAWQFPHFCALSWNLQSDYSRAGYRMMSVIDSDLCRRVSLRYSLALSGITLLFPVCNVTTWTFAADSLPLNSYLIYLAFDFYRKGDSSSSRKLFRFTLVHLPLLLVFMIISKTHFGDDVSNHDNGGGEVVEMRVE